MKSYVQRKRKGGGLCLKTLKWRTIWSQNNSLFQQSRKNWWLYQEKGQRGRQGLTGSHLGLSSKVSKRSRPLTGKSGAPYRPSILDQFSNQHLFIRGADVWRAREVFGVWAFSSFRANNFNLSQTQQDCSSDRSWGWTPCAIRIDAILPSFSNCYIIDYIYVSHTLMLYGNLIKSRHRSERLQSLVQ